MPNDTTSPTRVLLVTTLPLSPEDVRRVLAETALDHASVRVLAPSLNDSALAFWVSDADEAIAEAQVAAAETAGAADRVTGEGADVSAVVGDSDPLLAIGDALAAFPADEIITVYRTGEQASYREDRLAPSLVRRTFGLPVRAHEVGRSASGALDAPTHPTGRPASG